jgi:hypothetical protein
LLLPERAKRGGLADIARIWRLYILKSATYSLVRVPLSAVAATPIIAMAPIGRGLRMIPTLVATKIANKCHALGWTPSGAGTKQITTASEKTPSTRNPQRPITEEWRYNPSK